MSPIAKFDPLTHQSTAEPSRWDGHMCDGVASTFGPAPLAFLSATPDELLLCGNRGSFRLPRGNIHQIGRGGFFPWMFSAVRIHHDVRNYPRELQFKPLDARPRDVLAQLKQLGYPIR